MLCKTVLSLPEIFVAVGFSFCRGWGAAGVRSCEVIAGYPMQTVMRFSRRNGQNGNKKAVTKQISPALAFSGRSC